MAASCAAPSETYLDAARDVGRWLQSQSVSVGQRVPDTAEDPSMATWDIGTGAAGRAVFLLELHRAAGDDSFLESARRELEGALTDVSTIADADLRFGLYNGLTGVAVASAEFYRVTSDDAFAAAARELVDRLDRAARSSDAGGSAWNAANDVLAGTAGIGLGLLRIAEGLDEPRAVELARQAGIDLLNRARDAGGGWWWSRGANNDLNLPNFSHGTAGVGFFLARLYLATRDPVFLDAAVRAATYLRSVADTTDGLFLVPYGIPNDGYVTVYDIGWAHGPAGTAALFAALADITGDTTYDDIVAANRRTLHAAGLPTTTTDSTRWTGPFPIDRRFGTSGAATFLLRMEDGHPDRSSRRLAHAIVDDLLARAVRDSSGMRWTLPRYGFQGDEGAPATFTGFFYGAAGLGLTLLDAHAGVGSRW